MTSARDTMIYRVHVIQCISYC